MHIRKTPLQGFSTFDSAAVYCMVPKRGDSQKIIRDESKLQTWMLWGDPGDSVEK